MKLDLFLIVGVVGRDAWDLAVQLLKSVQSCLKHLVFFSAKPLFVLCLNADLLNKSPCLLVNPVCHQGIDWRVKEDDSENSVPHFARPNEQSKVQKEKWGLDEERKALVERLSKFEFLCLPNVQKWVFEELVHRDLLSALINVKILHSLSD